MDAKDALVRQEAKPLRMALAALLLVALAVFGTPTTASAAPNTVTSGAPSVSATVVGAFAPTVSNGARPMVAASCGGGRCTVWFSKDETRRFAEGYVSMPPLPGVFKPLFWVAFQAHRMIAKSYAARGWCSGFRLSAYPWESQGYFGYRC